MSPNILEIVRMTASDIFSVPLAQVRADSSPETIATWDSVQHLTLALALEEKFGIQLSPEEIESMRNIGGVATLIEGKLRSAPN